MTEETSFVNPRGERLVGTLHRPASAPPVAFAIVCHGLLSSRSSPKHRAVCEELARRGATALRFDFAGRGESGGRTEDITYEREVEDLAAAAAALAPAGAPLLLVGSSMGGAVSLLFAPEARNLAGVATMAAPSRPAELPFLTERGGVGADWLGRGTIEVDGERLGAGLLESARRANVLGAAASLECPLLVIHGELDEVVPVAQAVEIHRAARRSRLEILERADHRLSSIEAQERAVELIGGFFDEVIVSHGARP